MYGGNQKAMDAMLGLSQNKNKINITDTTHRLPQFKNVWESDEESTLADHMKRLFEHSSRMQQLNQGSVASPRGDE